MEVFEDVMRNLEHNAFRPKSSSKKLKLGCFPFSVSRMTNRLAYHLFYRHKRRPLRKTKHYDQLTTNMDSYQYTPSNTELQQLLYS